MTDEKYLFITDSADKKRTARGIHNKRTHNGKGGGVKMPSDYMTRKERSAMNSEIVSYQLNKPMSWKQYKQMPSELKREYLEWIEKTFNPSRGGVAKMFEVSNKTITDEFARFGKKGQRGGQPARVRDAKFNEWIEASKNEPKAVETQVTQVTQVTEPTEEKKTAPAAPLEFKLLPQNVPASGELTFNATIARDAFNVVYPILQTTPLKYVRISWEVDCEQATV